MQNTSATWKTLAANQGTRVEAKAIINGVEYTGIEPPVITRGLLQNGLEVGNVVSATCSLTLDTDNNIPKSAEVQIKTRLVGSTEEEPVYSEWLPQGTFYISKRIIDPITGLRRFECYDALLKSNAVLEEVPWTDESGRPITTESGEVIMFSATFPRDMKSLVYDIAYILDIQIDSRTVINEGSQYKIVELPDGSTIRDALSLIAQAHGANWIVTPDNKLRLVPVVDWDDIDTADNVVEIEAVVGNYYVGERGAVSGIRVAMEGAPAIIGNVSDLVVDVSVSGVVAAELQDWLIGLKYAPYTFGNAFYDIAAELGDYVRFGDIESVLYSETVTLGHTMHGDISAPDSAEMSDEYPYVSYGDKTAVMTKAYVREATQQLNNSLNQEEIFNRLTDHGVAQGLIMYNGQLYINAEYIRTGTLVADLIKAGILSDIKGMNYWNMETGEFSLAAATTVGGSTVDSIAQNKASAAVTTLDQSLNQQSVFNRLTNNGQTQGIYLTNGNLYINGTYINSGTVKAQYLDGDNLHVKAANIDGTLVIGQLPSDVATESEVTTITNDTIKTTNVTAQNLKVKAANIDGVLVIGQLPSSVAETSDIPTKVSELTNDSGFQNSTQVTTITNNTIKTTNVTATNLKVKAANVEDTFTANKIVGGTLTLGGSSNASGTLTVKDASNNTIGTWNKDGISVKEGSITGGTIDGATLTLGGNSNASGVLTVKDASNNTIGTWDNSGITLNKGSIAGPSLTLGGNSNANGVLTVKDASGNTIGTWDKNGISVNKGSITGGTINGATLTLGGSNNASGTLTVQDANGNTIGILNQDGINIFKGNIQGSNVILTGSGSTAYGNYIEVDSINGNQVVRIDFSGITIGPGIAKYGGLQFVDATDIMTARFRGAISSQYGYGVKLITCSSGTDQDTYLLYRNRAEFNAETVINGNFTVSSGYTKSKVITTDQYSDRLLYCYETPSPLFGDVGEAVIGDDGLCYVTTDPIFAQIITTDNYQVFLQRYGAGDCYVQERKGGWFVVAGTPGLAFGWEIKGKQADIADVGLRRLDRNDEKFTVPTQTYGEDAANHIDEIRKEREAA